MVTYQLIPTKEIREEARKQGKKPMNFIREEYQSLRYVGEDKRRRDLEDNVLEDIMFTRTDGTRIIIHEMESYVDELQLMEISEIDEDNNITMSKLAYTDTIDYEKLQKDSEYRDAYIDLLLDRERIEQKNQEAQNYGSKDIYVGTIQRNPRTNEYGKYAYNYSHIKNIIHKSQEMRRMITELNAKIKQYNTEELVSVYETLFDVKMQSQIIRLIDNDVEVRNNSLIKPILTYLKSMTYEDLYYLCSAFEIDTNSLEQLEDEGR